MNFTIPETSPDYDRTRIIERPDGFFWQDKETDEMFGPFATLLETVQDMQYTPDSNYEPGESLAEAEAEVGMSEWIDPETGEPAEESPRLEEH